jgi:hypothetical protein
MSLTCILMVDVTAELARPGHQFKIVFNERGAIVAPGTLQHDTLRAPGIAYAHDHAGNALAAMVYGGRIEIRGHGAFAPERVRLILGRLAELPQLEPLRGHRVTYRGAVLPAFGSSGHG